MWVDNDGTGGFKHSIGKGPRLIILHAGGVAGWVSKTDLIFRSKKSPDGDYQMNAEHFFLGLNTIFAPIYRSAQSLLWPMLHTITRWWKIFQQRVARRIR